MIKNWEKFNEAYDQNSLQFTREETNAFSDYYRDKIISSIDKTNFLNILKDFIEIVNEEFDTNINISFDDIYFTIIEPLNQEVYSSLQLPNQIKSSSPSTFPTYSSDLGIENASKIWELLKYKNYKPGFLAKLKLPIDEELKNPRWCHYYQKVLQGMNKIPNTQIAVCMGTATNSHSRNAIGFIPFYVYLRYEDFKFIDPFQKENVISFLEEYPKHVNALYKWADKDEIFDFIIGHPEVKQKLEGQNLLDFTKKYKSIHDTERTQMESENQMYIFIARPAFKEQTDGNYKKDLEIENLVPIDPYDAKDAHILSMMKLRARMQSNNSEVYCIWLPNDFEESELSRINQPELDYLRKLIDQKKEKI